MGSEMCIRDSYDLIVIVRETNRTMFVCFLFVFFCLFFVVVFFFVVFFFFYFRSPFFFKRSDFVVNSLAHFVPRFL